VAMPATVVDLLQWIRTSRYADNVLRHLLSKADQSPRGRLHPTAATPLVVNFTQARSARVKLAIRAATPLVEASSPAMSALKKLGTRVACQGHLNKTRDQASTPRWCNK
jgi:hypothetical protein